MGIDSSKLLIRQPTLLVSKLNPRKKTICIAAPQGDVPTLASGEFVSIQSDKFDQNYAYYVWLSEKVTDTISLGQVSNGMWVSFTTALTA